MSNISFRATRNDDHDHPDEDDKTTNCLIAQALDIEPVGNQSLILDSANTPQFVPHSVLDVNGGPSLSLKFQEFLPQIEQQQDQHQEYGENFSNQVKTRHDVYVQHQNRVEKNLIHLQQCLAKTTPTCKKPVQLDFLLSLDSRTQHSQNFLPVLLENIDDKLHFKIEPLVDLCCGHTDVQADPDQGANANAHEQLHECCRPQYPEGEFLHSTPSKKQKLACVSKHPTTQHLSAIPTQTFLPPQYHVQNSPPDQVSRRHQPLSTQQSAFIGKPSLIDSLTEQPLPIFTGNHIDPDAPVSADVSIPLPDQYHSVVPFISNEKTCPKTEDLLVNASTTLEPPQIVWEEEIQDHELDQLLNTCTLPKIPQHNNTDMQYRASNQRHDKHLQDRRHMMENYVPSVRANVIDQQKHQAISVPASINFPTCSLNKSNNLHRSPSHRINDNSEATDFDILLNKISKAMVFLGFRISYNHCKDINMGQPNNADRFDSVQTVDFLCFKWHIFRHPDLMNFIRALFDPHIVIAAQKLERSQEAFDNLLRTMTSAIYKVQTFQVRWGCIQRGEKPELDSIMKSMIHKHVCVYSQLISGKYGDFEMCSLDLLN